MDSIKLNGSLGPVVTVPDGGEHAIAVPFLIEDVAATGSVQAVALPLAANLTRPPSVVRVIVREPPSLKLASGEVVSASYRVEYSTHTAKEARVKITFPPTALTPPKFDLLVFP